MTTADQIRRWLQLAMGQDATHVIVVCDTFNYHDYPVIVGQGDDFWGEVHIGPRCQLAEDPGGV